MMEFSLLQPKYHDRKSFDCGLPELNTYLQKVANQEQQRDLSRTYVLADNSLIIGYYTLSAHAVSKENLPERSKLGAYNAIPFLLLGRLAVDLRYQGKGYGDALIFHAFHTTVDAAEKVGILGMVVDAVNERAVKFYEGFGLIRLQATPYRLVLPMKTIRSLLSSR
ncbi:MAG: GNAT family N-acetyltransferase [Symploca sp. SIO1C2]|nr:GNAT family N-acetyltransferase [Symploca sp. SIO1C2]